MISSQNEVFSKSSSKKGAQRKHFYLTCYLEVVWFKLVTEPQMLTFLGRVSFHENGIILEWYYFRMPALLHSSQFMVALLKAISPLEPLLVYSSMGSLLFKAELCLYSICITQLSVHPQSEMDFPLKELPLKHSDILVIFTSWHSISLTPASLFQRIQCQISSLISPYHPSLPACLLLSHTHAVFSTEQFQLIFFFFGKQTLSPSIKQKWN